MAMSVALPNVTPLPPDPSLHLFMESAGVFPSMSCGFEPYNIGNVKMEPQVFEEEPQPPPTPSFFDPPFSPPMSSANFSNVKLGHTDVYPETSDEHSLNSWAQKHPEHWEAREVLDWVYSLTDHDQAFDGALFRGEAYNRLTGRQLCNMSVEQFIDLDRHYGARVHDNFNWLLEDASFKKPLPPDMFKTESFQNGLPHCDFLQPPRDSRNPRQPPPCQSPPNLSVYVDRHGREMKVQLDGWVYDIDTDFTSITGKHPSHNPIEDSDYHSGSEMGPDHRRQSASSSLEAMFSEDEEEAPSVFVPDLVRKTHTPSSSSDSGCEGEERKSSSGRQRPTASKGNHLWEFIRDLLQSPMYNPNLVKWEDRDQGVFRFVQSEAVAQLWGRKKNNPQMTYEKLSRAMRFCRSAGYFDSVPKNGRFPKKLCFKFGHKAHGWQH